MILQAQYLAEAIGAGMGNSVQGFMKSVFKKWNIGMTWSMSPPVAFLFLFFSENNSTMALIFKYLSSTEHCCAMSWELDVSCYLLAA